MRLREVLSAVSAGERLVVCGDMNGHVGATSDGFEGVHGGFGHGVRNTEGEMLLELADAMDLVVANTWFKKDEQKLVTFESGGCRTVVDYILVPKEERKMVRNVTVVQGESSLQQHKLLLGVFQLGESRCRSRREVFVSKCKVWKLKEPVIRQTFEARVGERLANRPVSEADEDVEVVWSSLRKCLLDVAS